MLDFDNQTEELINEAIFEQIAGELTDKDFELLIVDDARIQELNLEHRGKESATDVLSFPITDEFSLFIGSVVISVDTANSAAKELGHALNDELKLLFIHGLLHLLGFDHETDSGQMRAKEEELILKFGLPESLIVRTESNI